MISRKYILRFTFFFLFLIGSLLIFSFKLIFIQIFRSGYLSSLAERQHNYFMELEPIRGGIFDRHLKPLAVNVPVYSLFANPRFMTRADKEKAIKDLSSLLQLDSRFLKSRLNKNKYFVWLKRKMSFEEVEKVKNLNIRGLDFIAESKRYYPNGELAAHVLGFAGIDNEGLEGLELLHNKILRGEYGWKRILRDAKQEELIIADHFLAPRHGMDLVLTLDETIQYLTERALNEAMLKHHAKAATMIVMDIKTGEILALANRPTYNLSEAFKSNIENRTNRAVAYVYEPGSVFKIVTAAAALEEKKFVENAKIFCENGEYRVANHTLHDHHPHGMLTFKEVFEQSSNIGVTKIAQKLSPSVIYQYGRRFRFGIKTDIDLLGEVPGKLKPPSVWSKTSIGAIPIGQEVTVTPLQLVCAMAAIANDGVYMRPFVVKYIKDQKGEIIRAFEPQEVEGVITSETAQRVKEILVGVTENGTGKMAKINGMRVAGKTGTAQKVINGVYSHDHFYATFIGFAPADHPRLAAVVVFDEPHPSYFGGTVAAPVFKEVIENSLKYLSTTETLTLLNKDR